MAAYFDYPWAIDITTGAQEGTEAALAKDPDTPEKKKKR